MVLLGPSNQLGVEFRRGHRPGRVVGVVQVEELGPLGNVFRDGIQVRQEVILRQQGHRFKLDLAQGGAGKVVRITRVRQEVGVAGVHQCPGQLHQTNLRAAEDGDLRLRVEVGPVLLLVEVGGRLLEGGQAPKEGVLMGLGIGHPLLGTLHDVVRGRFVGVPLAEVDDVNPFSDFLVNLGDQVGEELLRQAV